MHRHKASHGISTDSARIALSRYPPATSHRLQIPGSKSPQPDNILHKVVDLRCRWHLVVRTVRISDQGLSKNVRLLNRHVQLSSNSPESGYANTLYTLFSLCPLFNGE
jgi:hypothetical protein